MNDTCPRSTKTCHRLHRPRKIVESKLKIMREKNVTIKCEKESDKTDIIPATLTDRVKKRALKLKKEKEIDDMIKKRNEEMKNRQQEKDKLPTKNKKQKDILPAKIRFNNRISKPKNEKEVSELKKSGKSEKKSPINQKQQNEIMPTNNSAREF